ncbi:MAG: YdcF family protein [Elainellaceae cyanobacterium]
MIDPTDLWKDLNWTIFRWISSPKRVVVASLPVILVAFLPQSPSFLKLFGRGLAILLAIYLVLAAPPVASLLVNSLTVFLPKSSDSSADRIVVLSRGNSLGFDDSRYDLAIQLWQQDYAPQIFVTNYWNTEATAKRLEKRDISRQILDVTACSRTTYEEAVSAAILLEPQQVDEIILITDPPHMLRAMLTFEALGFTVHPKIIPFPSKFSTLRKSLLAIREYFGLANYAVLGRFRPQILKEAKESFDGQVSAERCTIELGTG